MKIWVGHGSEHSANLVIIGEFDTRKTADDVVAFIQDLVERAEADQATGIPAGKNYTQETLDFLMQNNIGTLSPQDLEQFLMEFHPVVEGNRVVVTTEEYDFQAVAKVMLDRGAKLEIYSAHQHPSRYGRQTYGRG